MQRDLVVRHEENCVHDIFSVQVSAIASGLVWQKWPEEDVDKFYAWFTQWFMFLKSPTTEKSLVRFWFQRN